MQKTIYITNACQNRGYRTENCMKGRNRAVFSASCMNNSFEFLIRGFAPIFWPLSQALATREAQARLASAGAPLPKASQSFSSWGEKVHSNPSALSAPVPPALQGQRLLALIHTLLPHAKPLRPSSQTNTVACRCTQAPLNKLVQIRKVIDVEIYLYFSQGEDCINFWIHSGITCPIPLSLHSNVLGHTSVQWGQGTAT